MCRHPMRPQTCLVSAPIVKNHRQEPRSAGQGGAQGEADLTWQRLSRGFGEHLVPGRCQQSQDPTEGGQSLPDSGARSLGNICLLCSVCTFALSTHPAWPGLQVARMLGPESGQQTSHIGKVGSRAWVLLGPGFWVSASSETLEPTAGERPGRPGPVWTEGSDCRHSQSHRGPGWAMRG